MTGGINQYYQISASPDLTNWTSLQTNLIRATNSIEINDTEAPSQGRRFYRAVLVP